MGEKQACIRLASGCPPVLFPHRFRHQIADNCIIGNYADERTADTKYDGKKGFGCIVIGNKVQIMPGVWVEVSLDADGTTVIGEGTHLGFHSYVKEQAHIGAYVTAAAYCRIGAHAVVEEHCRLGDYVTVGAYTHLKRGCDGVAYTRFEDRKTYGEGRHFSLMPAMGAAQYKKEKARLGYGNG